VSPPGAVEAPRSPPVSSFRDFLSSTDFESPPPPAPKDSSLSRHLSPRRGPGKTLRLPGRPRQWSYFAAFQFLKASEAHSSPCPLGGVPGGAFCPATAVFRGPRRAPAAGLGGRAKSLYSRHLRSRPKGPVPFLEGKSGPDLEESTLFGGCPPLGPWRPLKALLSRVFWILSPPPTLSPLLPPFLRIPPSLGI